MSLCEIHGCLEPGSHSVALDLDAGLAEPSEVHLGVTFAACPQHAALFEGSHSDTTFEYAVLWTKDE